MTLQLNNRSPYADSIYDVLMPMIEDAPDDIQFKTTAYNNYALYSLKQGELAKAAINYQKAIETSLNDFTKYSTYISGIHVFELMGNSQMIKQYIEQASILGERNNYKSRNSQLAMFKSKYLLDNGDLIGAKRELTNAIEYIPKISAKDHYGELIVTAMKYYSTISDWSSFEELLNKLNSELKTHQIHETGFYQFVLASIAYQKGDLSNAEKYGKKALAIAKNTNHKIKLRDSYKLLSQIYEKKLDHKLALSNQLSAERLTEEIFRNRQSQNVVYLGAVFEKKQQDLQIKVLNQENAANIDRIKSQNIRIIFGAIALAIFALLSILLWKKYKQVSSQKLVISKALSDKDMLLREIHHRVKNNLQLVSSLLTLQGRSISEETAQNAIQDGKNRVRSMALIHQDLYNRENLKGVSVKEYLEKLTSELFSTYKITGDKVDLVLDIDDIELDVDTMIPLGLIINELLTNSLKYAFENKENGTITVRLKEKEEKFYLQISDDGEGYDPNEVRANSFGTTLINALTEQIEGEMTHDLTNGTSVNITFNLSSTS